MPNFAAAQGAQEAKARADAASSGNRPDFFSLKSGQSAFVRPWTDFDQLITVEVHMGVKTKPAPKGVSDKKWPDTMSGVCQNDKIFRVYVNGEPVEPADWEDGYGSCYIHQFRQDEKGKYGRSVAETKPQTWGIFVMRQPLIKVSGRLQPMTDIKQIPDSFTDVLQDWTDKDGKVLKLPKIVLVAQSHSNFWQLFESISYMSRTMTTRDWRIIRSENEYELSAALETPDHKPGTPSWELYDRTVKLREIDHGAAIVRQASPDYYGRYFDERVTVEDEAGSGRSEAAQDTAADVSDADVQGVRDRMGAVFGEKDVFATQNS